MALLLLREMPCQFVIVDVVGYSAAISACKKGKLWEEALRLLQEMMHHLLTLNVVS